MVRNVGGCFHCSWAVLLALLLHHSPVKAQTFVQQRPDCIIVLTNLTAAGQTSPTAPNAGLNNIQTGCNAWILSVNSTGFTAFTIALQSAPNTLSGGVNTPGTWVTFANPTTTLYGTNPIVGAGAGAAGVLALCGYNPWVRVSVNAVTGVGTINGVAFGYSIPSACSSQGGEVNVNLNEIGGAAYSLGQKTMANSAPVTIASDQSAVSSFLGCPNSVDVALSGTTYTEIVAGVASQVIRVCKIFATSVSGGNPVVNTFTIASATVSTCASPTELMLAGGVTGLDSDFGWGLRSASSASICIKEAVGNSDKVTITYAQF